MRTRVLKHVTSDPVSPPQDTSDDGTGGSRRQLHVATLADATFALGSKLLRMARSRAAVHVRNLLSMSQKHRPEPISKCAVLRLIARSEGKHERVTA